MTSDIGYREVDRDLVRLMCQRVSDAMQSVFQLSDDSGQSLMLGMAGAHIALASCAGAYAAHHEIPVAEVDPKELAEAVLKLMREMDGT